ncbi:predicted protein [Botrytis cinerea T4]|uniref:Uncharacterized protein n=1 Tax=Botryotinia fuckeliana (strain T4) TaxID=999810 RepID=G2YQQ6_BOTF4|nr:predicted protein [Botrytis cinerea T4]
MTFDLSVDFFPESLLDIYPYCFINLAKLFNNERRNTHFVKWKNEQLPSHEISTFSEQLLNNTSLEDKQTSQKCANPSKPFPAAATPATGSTDATTLVASTSNPPLVPTTIGILFARTMSAADARRMRRSRRDRRLRG